MMKKRHIILIVSLILVFLSSIEAQVNVTRVTDAAAFTSKEGAFYYLPGTYLIIDVCYDLVEKTRGPYAEYAFKFLGLDSVIKVNETHYEIKDVQCQALTGLDPGQIYFVEFLQKQSKDPLEMNMILSDEGYLTEVSMGMELSAQPFPEKTEEFSRQTVSQRAGEDLRFRYYATDNQMVKIDTIIKMVTIDTSTFRDVSYKRSTAYKTMEERASEAAEFIASIRKDRYKLLTGYQEVNYSKETMQYMDSRLLEMEDAYLSLFKGHCQRESYRATVVYFPLADEAGQEEIVLYVSNTEGITRSAAPQGTPVFIKVEPAGEITPSSLRESAGQAASGQGFVLSLPRLCHVSVIYKGRELLTKDMPIHQLGILSHYPATSRFHFKINPADGSVKHIGIR